MLFLGKLDILRLLESFHEHLYSLSQTLDVPGEDLRLSGLVLCSGSSPTWGSMGTLGASGGRIIILDLMFGSLVLSLCSRALGESGW